MSKLIEDPFEQIIECYNEGVKEQDAKGTADLFKKASEILFESIRNEFERHEDKINFTDIEYQNGYFIFPHGTNSIVHYHIDKCPGWLFGVWFRELDKRDANYLEDIPKTVVHYDWFAQYEDEIDKFKPSASMVCEEGRFDAGKEGETASVHKICRHIEFISEHPALAYYRDMHWADYNTEYVSEERAIEYMNDGLRKKELKEEYIKQAENEILECIKKFLIDNDYDYEMVDLGEGGYPRYLVKIPKSSINLAEGMYDFPPETKCEFDKIERHWQSKIEKECGSNYFSAYADYMSVYDDKEDK